MKIFNLVKNYIIDLFTEPWFYAIIIVLVSLLIFELGIG
jgi:hypothetical protein